MSPPARPGQMPDRAPRRAPPGRRCRGAGTSPVPSARGRAPGGLEPSLRRPHPRRSGPPLPLRICPVHRRSEQPAPTRRPHPRASGPRCPRRPGWRYARAPAHPRRRRARQGHERLDRVPAHQRVDRHEIGAQPSHRPKRSLDGAHQRLGVGGGTDGDVPRLPSAITSRPRALAWATTASRALHPGALSRSKQASCSFTATHASAVASINARQ